MKKLKLTYYPSEFAASMGLSFVKNITKVLHPHYGSLKSWSLIYTFLVLWWSTQAHRKF